MTLTIGEPVAAVLCFVAGAVVTLAGTTLLVAWSIIKKTRG